MSIRRLPVYLVLDCSESMAGPAMEAVNRGVATLLAELKSSPQALETVFLSIITFSSNARQVVPLTEILQVQLPRLSIRPGTALGAALQLLGTCLKRDVVRTDRSTKGDYRPLVFLMTDGQPTDAWEDAANTIRGLREPKIANLYAIGCGDDVDGGILYRITDVVLKMPDMSPEAFRKFFVWLTASVSSASLCVADGKDNVLPNSVPLPDDVLMIAPREAPREDARQRQVFLRACCSKTKRPYLMRFGMAADGVHYAAKAAHPLEDASGFGGSEMPAVDSSLLLGCPSCPHCGNPRAGMCPCGTLFCNSTTQVDSITCPTCHAELKVGGGGGFSLRQSSG